MFHKTARLLMVGALSVSALGLTGCSDEEVSFGAGLIIGTIIGDASNDHHHHHDRDHGPRDRPFRPRGDVWGIQSNRKNWLLDGACRNKSSIVSS